MTELWAPVLGCTYFHFVDAVLHKKEADRTIYGQLVLTTNHGIATRADDQMGAHEAPRTRAARSEPPVATSEDLKLSRWHCCVRTHYV